MKIVAKNNNPKRAGYVQIAVKGGGVAKYYLNDLSKQRTPEIVGDKNIKNKIRQCSNGLTRRFDKE